MSGVPIEVRSLTKTFHGGVHAVAELTFTVAPGRVTGFLGPNGSGKTTSLRCVLGLVTPTSGQAFIGGMPYQDLPDPARTVGAALEASGFHPGRTARNHLRVIAAAAGIAPLRADDVLEFLGLGPAADRKAGDFSLGMRQRLALGAALLGDPGVLILDEPANGLDPEGIAWLRNLLRSLAAEGRTVLVSSHVLSEVRQTVDDVVIISKGRLVHAGALEDLGSGRLVIVRSPDCDRLASAVESAGGRIVQREPDSLHVADLTTDQVGAAAWQSQCQVLELRSDSADLESLFLELTGGQP